MCGPIRKLLGLPYFCKYRGNWRFHLAVAKTVAMTAACLAVGWNAAEGNVSYREIERAAGQGGCRQAADLHFGFWGELRKNGPADMVNLADGSNAMTNPGVPQARKRRYWRPAQALCPRRIRVVARLRPCLGKRREHKAAGSATVIAANG